MSTVSTYNRVPLEDDNSASLVTSGKQVSIMVEFNTRDDVSLKGRKKRLRQLTTTLYNSITITFCDFIIQCALNLGETPLNFAISYNKKE